MAIEIEKGISAPSQRGKYPFTAMEVGDSFFVPGVTTSKLVNAAQAHRSNGRKYTTRTENGGARVWRIA